MPHDLAPIEELANSPASQAGDSGFEPRWEHVELPDYWFEDKCRECAGTGFNGNLGMHRLLCRVCMGYGMILRHVMTVSSAPIG